MIQHITTLLLVFSLTTAGVAIGGDTDAAKDRYLSGVALFKEENYLAALEAFEDSYRLVPKTSVLYNIGMCQMALFRFADALATFRQYLDEGVDKEWKREKVDAAINEINKMVGTLAVADAPEGAEIYIDGERVGESPLAAPVVLDPGQHKVRVTQEGFRPMETTVTIASEAAVTIRAPLDQARGTVEIRCDHDNATVVVDGTPVGGCPFEGTVAPGTRQISVRAPGMAPAERRVAVTPGARITVDIALEPLAGGGRGGPGGTPVSKKRRPVLIGLGAAALTVGAGLAAMGGYFNTQAGQDAEQGQTAADAMADETDRENYLALDEQRKTAVSDLKGHQAIMIAGYAAGGALIVTGVALMVVGLKKGDGEGRVSATGTGLTVRF